MTLSGSLEESTDGMTIEQKAGIHVLSKAGTG
jgi:hypothetical protein